MNYSFSKWDRIWLTTGAVIECTFRSRYIENTYIVLPYIKISNEVGRIDNFRALARKLSFLPTELDIFDIRQHYVRILFIFQCLICCLSICLTPTNMNLAVYGNGSRVVMTS